MRALKGFVIVLGLTIVFVMGVMVWGLFKKSENPDFKMFTFSGLESGKTTTPSAASSVPAPTGITASWGTVSLNLPMGCAIGRMETQPGKLFIHARPRADAVSGCSRVTVIDPDTGHVLGTIVGGP